MGVLPWTNGYIEAIPGADVLSRVAFPQGQLSFVVTRTVEKVLCYPDVVVVVYQTIPELLVEEAAYRCMKQSDTCIK